MYAGGGGGGGGTGPPKAAPVLFLLLQEVSRTSGTMSIYPPPPPPPPAPTPTPPECSPAVTFVVLLWCTTRPTLFMN